MQAPTPSQRSVQRRSPGADPGPPPNVPARTVSPSTVPQSRPSTSSGKSGPTSGSRRVNGGSSSQSSQSGPPLSQIEKSVTHLLVATKQLLETLTQWSRHQATDAQVSDVYVRLGYEFNIACRAFTAINVDTNDLGNVPESLRHILEATLSQEASVESLEKYLPRIRDIIINLLHGLKRKQQKLRQKQPRDGLASNGESSLPRNTSTSSVGSSGTGLTTLLNEGLRENGAEIKEGSTSHSREASGIPPRMSSASAGSPNRRGLPARDNSRSSISSEQSTLSSATMQNIPVLPPYPGDETTLPTMPRPESGDLNVDAFPPVPPPKQNALMALQRGPDLERRASRRHSAYIIAKNLGASAMPMLPPQNSPIPNRGRDVRESMNAVRGRGTTVHNRQQSNNRVETDDSSSRIPSRISEETDPKIVVLETPKVAPRNDSPTAKTPEDKLRKPIPDIDRPPSATLNGPPSDAMPVILNEEEENNRISSQEISPAVREPPKVHTEPVKSTPQKEQFVPEQSPQPGKELTLFLQYKTKIKKFVLADGYNDLSIARLQLAFIEKFAWNTHNNGVDLPEIYIQDPVSGVRHELEDLTDIKDRSVLVLNVDALDEVKRHVDESFGGLKNAIESVKMAVDDQKLTMQRVSERQQDTAKEMARLAAAPAPPRMSLIENPRINGIVSATKASKINQISEVQSLRRDLAVLRQTYSSFQSDIENSMSEIRNKAKSVKAVAINAAVPTLEGDTGRAYVDRGKKTLSEDSDRLVGRVDDLQDIVEDLRKDVVTRGVRPLPRQLEGVAKDISLATQELKKLQEFLKRERPIWTKIWEKELETVCNDREEITLQEDLAADLQDDLEKAAQTFALVEQATKEQMKDAAPGAPSSGRAISRGLNHVTVSDPTIAKEGVLDEVRALQPNHEDRLEAIERAEKLRRKELEGRRGGEFAKELGEFVEEGKLKKSGGYEEVERARKAKDDKIRKEVWERQNGMTQADATAVTDSGVSFDAVDPPISEETPAEDETVPAETVVDAS